MTKPLLDHSSAGWKKHDAFSFSDKTACKRYHYINFPYSAVPERCNRRQQSRNDVTISRNVLNISYQANVLQLMVAPGESIHGVRSSTEWER